MLLPNWYIMYLTFFKHLTSHSLRWPQLCKPFIDFNYNAEWTPQHPPSHYLNNFWQLVDELQAYEWVIDKVRSRFPQFTDEQWMKYLLDNDFKNKLKYRLKFSNLLALPESIINNILTWVDTPTINIFEPLYVQFITEMPYCLIKSKSWLDFLNICDVKIIAQVLIYNGVSIGPTLMDCLQIELFNEFNNNCNTNNTATKPIITPPKPKLHLSKIVSDDIMSILGNYLCINDIFNLSFANREWHCRIFNSNIIKTFYAIKNVCLQDSNFRKFNHKNNISSTWFLRGVQHLTISGNYKLRAYTRIASKIKCSKLKIYSGRYMLFDSIPDSINVLRILCDYLQPFPDFGISKKCLDLVIIQNDWRRSDTTIPQTKRLFYNSCCLNSDALTTRMRTGKIKWLGMQLCDVDLPFCVLREPDRNMIEQKPHLSVVVVDALTIQGLSEIFVTNHLYDECIVNLKIKQHWSFMNPDFYALLNDLKNVQNDKYGKNITILFESDGLFDKCKSSVKLPKMKKDTKGKIIDPEQLLFWWCETHLIDVKFNKGIESFKFGLLATDGDTRRARVFDLKKVHNIKHLDWLNVRWINILYNQKYKSKCNDWKTEWIKFSKLE